MENRGNYIAVIPPMHVDKDMHGLIELSSNKFTPKLTVKDIFLDNHNWDRVQFLHSDIIRAVEIKEVNKMLSCKERDRGFFVYYCEKCERHYIVAYGCNSRICSNCGKNYTDKWSVQLSKKMFRVPHRHIVLSMPDKLWPELRLYRDAWKVVMDSAIRAINDVLSKFLQQKILAGAIVVLHPFGRDLEFKPHLHILMTEGGFDRKCNFIPKDFIPGRAMRKTWQYQLLTNLKKVFPQTSDYSRFIDGLFKSYPEGFYAWLPEESRITSNRITARYIGRYVRHPAIANSRICNYNGENVTFWYKDNEEKMHYKTMKVDEFILALIQHIPEPQFKMIRYYGAYCRKWKGRYSHYLIQRSITQSILEQFETKKVLCCPKCGSKLIFDFKLDKPPPEKYIYGGKITDWVEITDSVGVVNLSHQ